MANKSNVVTIDATANAAAIVAANAEAEAKNEAKKMAYELGRSSWLLSAASLGSNLSKAATSPFELAMEFQQAIRDGFAKAIVDDAKAAVEAYRSGKIQADKNAIYGTLGVDDAAKALASLQTAASNLLTFATPCAMVNPKALYTAIDASVAGYKAADITGSKIRCYEKVNRELHKLYEKLGDVDAVFKAASGDAMSTWLIRKGATPVGDGSEGDGDGASGKNAKKEPSTPIDKIDAALKVLKAMAKSEYQDDAEYKRVINQLELWYLDQRKAVVKSAA